MSLSVCIYVCMKDEKTLLHSFYRSKKKKSSLIRLLSIDIIFI